MSKNTSALITNNIITLIIHGFLCIILYVPSVYINEGLSLSTFYWFAGLYAIVLFGLYFLAGRLFLHGTKNMLTDVFSVVILLIVLLAGAAYYWIGSTILFLFIPYYPFGEMLRVAISHIFQMPYLDVKIKYMFMILSPLPSLALLSGVKSKQYVDTLQIQQPQSTLKNRLLLIISKKKQSSILFIALICSIYLALVINLIIMLSINVK